VLKCKADGKGGQTIENTGPLPKERMETVDEEFLAAAKDFIKRKNGEGVPWFCYFNSTRMHVFTHLKKESDGVTGLGLYPDGMVEHDGHVGQLLALIDELGIADNTIVVYTTDNGAEVFTFPDGGATPFRGEKATNYEGGFRVPALIRWPGVIKPGTIVNDICAHEDFIPTFAAAAGEPDLVEKLKRGHRLRGKTFKVHLDGHNLLPFLKGEEKNSPREGFLYWSDDGDLLAVRVREWKIAFMEQHAELSATLPVSVWQGQFTKLRVPMLYNIKSDPFERGPESIFYARWQVEHVWVQVPVQVLVHKWIESFKEFPPRHKAASFTVSDVMEKITTASAAQN
jgi:arylsulfatase